MKNGRKIRLQTVSILQHTTDELKVTQLVMQADDLARESRLNPPSPPPNTASSMYENVYLNSSVSSTFARSPFNLIHARRNWETN